jgi:hypothetical protein
MDLPGWQALRSELHPLGVEVVTVGLEMGGADIVRPFIEDAHPEHPSLVDETHRLDALFGVTNIPSAIWIDEAGVIVRPHESAIPPPVLRPDADGNLKPWGMGGRADDPERYANRLRDWARRGADCEHVLSPDEVIARSQPRSMAVSQGAAHFELAQHLWRLEGFSARTLEHFGVAHTLQPDNITYKRQAYSAYSFGRAEHPTDRTRFVQAPSEGEEGDWPFVSDFNADMAALQAQRQREREAREQAAGSGGGT